MNLLSTHPNTHPLPLRPKHPTHHSNIPLGPTAHLQLDRTPISLPSPPPNLSQNLKTCLKGVSQKKAHEITRLITYIHSEFPDVEGVVDVGAGVGHLSRALVRVLGCRVLAIDVHPPKSKEKSKEKVKAEAASDSDPEPLITRLTTLLTPQTLLDSICTWSKPTEKILLVSLHGCGSLAIDTIRAYLLAASASASPPTSTSSTTTTTATTNTRTWIPLGVISIGCCYNLLHPSDFPLSRTYTTFYESPHPPPSGMEFSSDQPTLTSLLTSLYNLPAPYDLLLPFKRQLREGNWAVPSIPSSAYHLASQTPSTWYRSDDPVARKVHELSLRKVVWRAMLARVVKRLNANAKGTPNEYRSIRDSEDTNGKRMTDEGYGDGKTYTPIHYTTIAHVPSSSFSDGRESDRDVWVLGKLPKSAYERLHSESSTFASHSSPESSVGAETDADADTDTDPNSDEATFTSSTYLPTVSQKLGVPYDELRRVAEGMYPNPPTKSTRSDADANANDSSPGKERECDYDYWALERVSDPTSSPSTKDEEGGDTDTEPSPDTEEVLTHLQTLRCLLGPVIESVVLLDRVSWVQESLSDSDSEMGEAGKGGGAGVKLVPLFDQMEGSARNMGIVIRAEPGCTK